LAKVNRGARARVWADANRSLAPPFSGLLFGAAKRTA